MRYTDQVETNSNETGLRIDEILGPEPLGQLSGLLDRAFGVPPGRRYFDDFPVWEPTAAIGAGSLLRVGAFDRNRLVSSACVRIAHLKTPGLDLPIALIGAVATDEQWRGKGLASQLVELACDWARENRAALVMLWGSEHELYRKLGFELCGQQIRVPLGALQLPKSSSGLVQEGWAPGIFSFLRERNGGLRLGDADRTWVEKHRNVRWYWTGTRDAPLAYAGFGRGIDLHNIVHEWGGEPAQLSAILSRIQGEFPEATLLASPIQMNERFGVESGSVSAETEFLALVRILDPSRILECWQPAPRLTAGLVAEPAGSRQWKLSLPGEQPWISQERDLPRLLFGPRAGPIGEAPRLFAQYLPFQFWIWGLDAA